MALDNIWTGTHADQLCIIVVDVGVRHHILRVRHSRANMVATLLLRGLLYGSDDMAANK